MKKHNEQLRLMNLLDNAGLRFRGNELTPHSIKQYFKRNGGGDFALYITNDVDVASLISNNDIEATMSYVTLDNGFKTQDFEAIKVTF